MTPRGWIRVLLSIFRTVCMISFWLWISVMGLGRRALFMEIEYWASVGYESSCLSLFFKWGFLWLSKELSGKTVFYYSLGEDVRIIILLWLIFLNRGWHTDAAPMRQWFVCCACYSCSQRLEIYFLPGNVSWTTWESCNSFESKLNWKLFKAHS